MIQVTLDRKDLISLIKGTYPDYQLMDHPMIKSLGEYRGGFYDRWEWHYSESYYNKFTEEQLLEIYKLCKS